MPTEQTRSILRNLLKLGVSITLLALLIRYVSVDSVRAVAQRASIPLLALGSACAILQMAFTTIKWRLLLVDQNIDVRFWRLFQIQLTSQFANLFMPSVLGGDALRAAMLRKHTGSIRSALPSVIVDRGSGLLALIVIGTLGLAHLFANESLALVAALLLVVLIACYWLTVGPLLRYLRGMPPERFRNTVGIATQIVHAVRPSRILPSVAAISLLFQFNVVWITAIYAAAIGLDIDLWSLAIAMPATNFVEMVPISVSGIGVREATLVLVFEQLGLLAADGLALGLTLTVMRYVTGLFCGIAILIPLNQPQTAPASSVSG